MRDVMGSAGGFCARGGPYVIGSECSDGQVALLTITMLGLFVFFAVYAGFTAWSGGPVLGGSLLLWGATFGVLGWNFMDLGLDPPRGQGSVWGWLVSGVVFWLMAACALVPAALMGIGWLRRGGAPEPPRFREPLVRAATPGGAAPVPESPGRATATDVPKRLVPPPPRDRGGP